MWALRGFCPFGLSAGYFQKEIDGSLLRTPDGVFEDGVFNPNDDLLPEGVENAAVNFFNVGVYYLDEQFEAGISSANILEPSADFGTVAVTLNRNYFVTASYHLDINSSLKLHPSLLIKSDFTQTQIEISSIIQYNDNIFGGASFRGYNADTKDAVAIIAGFKLSENITLAYAYDITLSDLKLVSNGSHEILINYNLNKRIGAGKPPRIIYNPRSL